MVRRRGCDLHWELLENTMQPRASHRAAFTLINSGEAPVQPGWTLYFNAIYVHASAQSQTSGATLEHLSGDFFRISTDETVGRIEPGDSLLIEYRSGGFLMKNTQVPEGVYIVPSGELAGLEFESYTYSRIEVDDQLAMFAGTTRPVPGPEYLFSLGEDVQLLSDTELPPVIPAPKWWEYRQGRIQVQAGFQIVTPPVFETEAQLFADAVQGAVEQYSGELSVLVSADQHTGGSANGIIPVRLRFSPHTHPEGYTLQIGANDIQIEASGNAGMFYGLQTLLSMISAEVSGLKSATDMATIESLSLPRIRIEDAPRFSYRGLFLDIARNYQQPADIKRLIDLMALYKFNVLQLHLANDEAWRIEIPGLPELTHVGARRGHAENEHENLWPYYGSGPNPDDSRFGSGYLSRQQFIEILRYAQQRHIEVIPEIVAPGHMKAAIYAMENRYRRLMESEDRDAAVEFLLKHPQDTSEYLSIQRYRRNTMDVCMESSYRFYAHVTDAILEMYHEADVPIRTFHTGGDEVPRGVWAGSPACADLIASEPELTGPQDLHNWFYRRLAIMLEQRGLQLAGWEEVGQVRVREGERYVHRPNPELLGKGFRLHAWNAVVGWPGTDMAYQLANAGYEVVMSNSSNVYFDLAYDMDPDEPGLHWSGFVNVKSSWQMTPFNHFISNDTDMAGNPVDAAVLAATHERLTDEGKSRIIGLQGQLWTETVRGPDMMFYYLLPKMLGLAERAWSPDPDWSHIVDETERREMMQIEWNRFANAVGQRELPMLEIVHGGYTTRISKPGARIAHGYLHANTDTPGLIIRFTLDGSEPNEQSNEYLGPISILELRHMAKLVQSSEDSNVALRNQSDGVYIKLRAFTPSGRSGATTRFKAVIDESPVIRLMTYNIRLNTSSDGINAWPHRADHVADMMVHRHGADIIGVQEALWDQLNDLTKRLPGYRWVGVARADGDRRDEFSAIFFREDRFELIETNTFWLSLRPYRPGSSSWDAAITRIVTWARFKDYKTDAEFVVFNTHFDHRGQRSRRESARLLRRMMPDIANGAPYILMGDFNDSEKSRMYSLLTGIRGLEDARYLSETEHQGPTATFTNWVELRDPETRIDFIFVKEPIRVLRHMILDDRYDGRFPSDHLPVVADILLPVSPGVLLPEID
jgi:hexosaminidase